jgi:hypothetical protein
VRSVILTRKIFSAMVSLLKFGVFILKDECSPVVREVKMGVHFSGYCS